MALIECPECTTQVSDKAAACPKCAYPIAADAREPEEVQTIEQTGKVYKAQTLLSVMMIFFGMLACIGGASSTPKGEAPAGMWIFLAGAVWFIVVRFLSWWDHG